MKKLLILGAMTGIGLGIAKYVKKKKQSETENTENKAPQSAA